MAKLKAKVLDRDHDYILLKIRKDDFTPLHELGIFCKMKKNAFPSVEIDFSQAISFLKKENIELKNASKGWT